MCAYFSQCSARIDRYLGVIEQENLLELLSASVFSYNQIQLKYFNTSFPSTPWNEVWKAKAPDSSVFLMGSPAHNPPKLQVHGRHLNLLLNIFNNESFRDTATMGVHRLPSDGPLVNCSKCQDYIKLTNSSCLILLVSLGSRSCWHTWATANGRVLGAWMPGRGVRHRRHRPGYRDGALPGHGQSAHLALCGPLSRLGSKYYNLY